MDREYSMGIEIRTDMGYFLLSINKLVIIYLHTNIYLEYYLHYYNFKKAILKNKLY